MLRPRTTLMCRANCALDALPHFRQNFPQYLEENTEHEVVIGHVYDPSKFWMIVRFKELEAFMKLILAFYQDKSNCLVVDKKDLCIEFPCVIYTNDWYYRAVVINNVQCKRVRVFLVDYGFFVTVQTEEVFHLHKKFSKIGRFSVRAGLSGIKPKDSSKFWPKETLDHFKELIYKLRLFVRIKKIDQKQHICWVALRELCGYHADYINDMLVSKDLAQVITKECTPSQNLSRYEAKVQHVYLLPSFDMVEEGKVPASLAEFYVLSQTVCLDLLYKHYFCYIKS